MKYLATGLALVAATGAQADGFSELWSTGGMISPESAYFDAEHDQIVVSNIGVFGPDGGMDGALSLLGPDGAVMNTAWVTGLMDPKGMDSSGETLYVADAIGLQVIDIASGSLVETITLPGAIFPNDVAIAADGAVYVTDMMGGAIYRVQDGVAEAWLGQGSVPLPNGIWADGDRLIVGSFGDALNPDFSVNNPGGLLSVDLASGTLGEIDGTQGTGSIDGVVAVGERLVYDDNPTGAIYSWADGTNEKIAETESGAADLGVMGDVILVPNLNTGMVTAYQLE